MLGLIDALTPAQTRVVEGEPPSGGPD
jgi:hypothetical protein